MSLECTWKGEGTDSISNSDHQEDHDVKWSTTGMVKQPLYETTIQSQGRQVLCRPNVALASRSECAILFKKLTKEEDAKVHRGMVFWWAFNWAAILAHYCGLCNVWVFACLHLRGHFGWAFPFHDSLHTTANPMPLLHRCALPFHGLMPVPVVIGDQVWDHRVRHHKETHAVIDVQDRSSAWSEIPLPLMIIAAFIQPIDFSAFFQTEKMIMGPSSLWRERAVVTCFYWAQLLLLYRMDLLWTVVLTGHIASGFVMGLFHGIIHRKSWYKCLIKRDPSGLRRLPQPLDMLMELMLGPAGWVEIRFHDVHHAFNMSTHIHALAYCGKTAKELESACAYMCDEGLFVDEQGKPMSPLGEVGHEIKSRERFLEKKEKKC